MNVLRDELHRAARLWNLHRIRLSTNVESLSGQPDVLFFLPEVSNKRNFLTDVDLDELELQRKDFVTELHILVAVMSSLN